MSIKKKYKFKGFGKMGKKSAFFLISSVLAVVLIIWSLFVVSDVFGWFGDDEQVMVSIPDGCTVAQMAEILKTEDVIEYAFAFRLYEKFDGVDHLFQKGGHLLNKGMSYGEIISRIEGKPDVELNEAIKVTIPEGFENRQIADKLAEAGLVDRQKFMDELEHGNFDYDFVKAITRTENRLEGYLFPATYDIYADDDEHQIICKMLDAFGANVVPLYEAAGIDMTLDEVVTFASLVEREAANDGERPIVASVFYNRLDVDMKLQSCASVQYVIKERKTVLSDADISVNSDYNTYMVKGLPVGPIASPGINSVKAVLSPAETDYMYFLARPDGSENIFMHTFEEHNKKKAELYSA